MFLWSSSETQKSEKDLDSFDTQVELIRLLQPEFDSVHLFQMWNKAYNVSVQYASLTNKYTAILDALQYGHRIDRSNPNNLNIINAIGGLYAEKLGNSTEKDYYRRRIRTETLPVYKVTFPAGRTDAFKKAVTDAGFDPSRVRITTSGGGAAAASAVLEKAAGDRVMPLFTGEGITYTPVARQTLRPEGAGGRRTEMDTLLDANGNILPQYLQGYRQVPPGGTEGNTGAELQYLAQFQPYPYGLSPVALGYNYYKRGQVLQSVAKQKHIQLSEMVIDNQPGLTLKAWSEEEWDRARRAEQRGLPKDPNADAMPRELKTAAAAPDARKITDHPAIDEAIFGYERAARVADAAIPEIQRHLKNFASNVQNYNSHMDNCRAIAAINRADARYLQAVLAPNANVRKSLLDQAKADYREAAKWFVVMQMKYYTDDYDAKAAGFARETVDQKTFDEIQALLPALHQHLVKKYKKLENVPNYTDIAEYDQSYQRAVQRLALIAK
jgi:hypothetical protein